MGFIGVSFRHPNVIIRFRPQIVSTAALGALLSWLARQAFQRICLSFTLDGQQQRNEIYSSQRAALLRMEALLRLADSTKARFVLRRGVLSDLHRSSCFSELFDHWRAVDGRFREDDFLPLLTRFAADRYSLSSPASPGANIDFLKAGKGLDIPDKSSHEGLNGSCLENFPDRIYGRWFARFYHETLCGGQPRFDHIRALIRWPRVGGVLHHYSRLLLPCHTEDGRPLLLGISGALAVPEFHA
jgi:hypothetical protein